jgi:hypothetical protein
MQRLYHCALLQQDATSGAVKGTLHRVRRGDEQRFCFIYEQKYEQFFPAPLD